MEGFKDKSELITRDNVRIRFNRRPTLAEDEILAARRRSYQTDGGDKENEDKGEEASKWRQRKTMFRYTQYGL